MAIYIDSNVLYPWRTLAELDRLALSIVASQIGQPILVASLVMEEVEAHHRRDLEAVLTTFSDARRELMRLFAVDVDVEPAPWIEAPLETWRGRLLEMAAVAPLDDRDAAAAHSREVLGEAPARARVPKKPGSGGRDAAIWLTVLRDHRQRREDGHFITRDLTGYFDGSNLRPRLLADLVGLEHPVHVYASVEDFLSQLGDVSTAEVELDALRKQAFDAIARGIEESQDLARSISQEEDRRTRRFRNALKGGTPVEIRAVRRYARGEQEVTIVDAVWELEVDVLYQDLDAEDRSAWFAITGVLAKGPVQVYLQAAAGRESAEYIASQLTSSLSVVIRPDSILTHRLSGTPILRLRRGYGAGPCRGRRAADGVTVSDVASWL